MQNQPNLLLAECDPSLTQWFDETLRTDGYAVTHACHGEQAWSLFCTSSPDLLLLGAGISFKEGMTLCSRIKATAPSRSMPILMIVDPSP
ncbi:MAG: response regulator transcription factor, partial [Magnetococcales bacterium]|nr:response regulator transcription factor [Magnetococcales bacterium]